MNLRQLEILHAVLRTGSVTEAARALNLSQPAVSIALRHYEDRLGAPIFHRSKGRLTPTAEALEMFPDIEDLLVRVTAVNRRLHDLLESRGGSLSILSTATIVNSNLASAIGQYKKRYPDVRIILRRMSTQQIIDQIERGEAELGLAHQDLPEENLEVERLAEIAVVCGLRTDHPLARKPSIQVGDLRGEPVITYGPAAPIGRPIRAAFAAAGIEIRDGVIVNDALTGFHLASAGAGIALVGHLGTRAPMMFPDLLVRPLRPKILAPVLLLTRKARPLSRNALRMIEFLRRSGGARG
ncbi:LysR family transcriptional regulator [Neoroseomonas terrae]|jgi:DNA-binding transcriptional LysR family regulator|nr:LysR family transcriptional regulator [Neoroseomonas terrae]